MSQRVLSLAVPNAFKDAVDMDITVIINRSSHAYGCTREEIITLPIEREVVE